MKDIFLPNRRIGTLHSNFIILFWIFLLSTLWITSDAKYFPTPTSILSAMQSLFVKHRFLDDILTSLALCIKSMFYSVLFCLLFSYMSVIPFLKPISNFISRSRFLTTIGLTVIFAQILPDTSAQKVALLVFGISVFLETSMMSVIMEVKKDELDYARTLRLNDWEVMWEVIIRGRLDQMFEMIRQNFAMAWMMLVMVENICRAEGGIGIVLNDQNRQYHYDMIYAIQIIVLLLGMGLDWLLAQMRGWFFPYSVLKIKR